MIRYALPLTASLASCAPVQEFGVTLHPSAPAVTTPADIVATLPASDIVQSCLPLGEDLTQSTASTSSNPEWANLIATTKRGVDDRTTQYNIPVKDWLNGSGDFHVLAYAHFADYTGVSEEPYSSVEAQMYLIDSKHWDVTTLTNDFEVITDSVVSGVYEFPTDFGIGPGSPTIACYSYRVLESDTYVDYQSVMHYVGTNPLSVDLFFEDELDNGSVAAKFFQNTPYDSETKKSLKMTTKDEDQPNSSFVAVSGEYDTSIDFATTTLFDTSLQLSLASLTNQHASMDDYHNFFMGVWHCVGDTCLFAHGYGI